MTGLFLTKPMSVWTPYGIVLMGCLAILILIMGVLGADCWRRYRYSGKPFWRKNTVYCLCGGLICLFMGLFVLLHRGWFMGAAFLIVVGLAYQTVGGGIRNQAERE